MLKLVVSDFDGTLLPYGENKVSNTVMAYIKTLLDRGVSFAVASGRTYSELRALLSEVGDRIYYICDDGALNVKDGKIIFNRHFDNASLAIFFDGDIFRNVTFYSLEKAYLWGDANKRVTYGKTPCDIKRLIDIKDDIFKITASVKNFDLISTKHFRVHYAEGDFAEFVPAYAHKGVAVADLQLKLGVTKFDTACFGDADNDIPMMSHAQNTFCIGSRSRALVDLCKFNTNTVQEALRVLTTNILK